MSTVFERAVELLGSTRLVIGVAGDEPGLLDAAAAAGGPCAGCRDQRTAAFAAAGASLTSGAPSVLCTHEGPDLLNALVGISEAHSARIPLLVVTQTTGSPEAGRGAFQGFPVHTFGPGLFRWTHRARDEADLYWALRHGETIARTAGGPVHVMVDAAIGAATAGSSLPAAPIPAAPARASEAAITAAARRLLNARRPVLILGGGARGTDPAAVTAVAEATGAVVLVTAAGRGTFPEDHPHFGGLAGLYLAPEAGAALAAADELLVIGSALEETARMEWSPHPDVRITQVDADPTVIGRALAATAVHGDAPAFVAALAAALAGRAPSAPQSWSGLAALPDDGSLTAPAVFRALSAALPGSGIEVLAQENGMADLWGYYAPALRLPTGIRTLVPGEQTALGFGLGAGLGAALTGSRVLAIGGDGAFGMNVPTLSTALENRATIAFVELIDGGFGWPSSTRATGDPLVNFQVPSGAAALAAATGTPSLHVTNAEELPEAFETILAERGPALLSVHLAQRRPFPPPSASPDP